MSTCGECRGKECFNVEKYTTSAPDDVENDEYDDVVETLVEAI